LLATKLYGDEAKKNFYSFISTKSAFSMNSMKVFPAFDEAGAVVCDEQSLRERLVYNAMRGE